jgi:hypothetical protein
MFKKVCFLLGFVMNIIFYNAYYYNELNLEK